MKSQDFEMSILVDNKPIEEYHHEGQVFVEGRKGSEYTIRLVNRSGRRTCFVVSIDGLSVLDGQEAGNKSPGYVLDGYQTLDLSCYKVDDKTGAQFEFGSKGDSYSAEIGKGTKNVGVIAALVFKEKTPGYHHHYYHLDNFPMPRYRYGAGSFSSSVGSNSAEGVKALRRSMAASDAVLRSSTRGIAPSGSPEEFEQQALGTSFGRSMEWKTRTVEFERQSEHPDASMVLYYDSRKNLEKRGITFRKAMPDLPNPFPANTGCPVPTGWKK